MLSSGCLWTGRGCCWGRVERWVWFSGLEEGCGERLACFVGGGGGESGVSRRGKAEGGWELMGDANPPGTTRTIVDRAEGISARGADQEEVCGGDDYLVMQTWGIS